MSGVRSHVTYAIGIKGDGRVVIEHGQAKGQPSSECYSLQLVKGEAHKMLKHDHCGPQRGIK